MKKIFLIAAVAALPSGAFGQCGSAGRLVVNAVTGLLDCTAVVGAGSGSVTSLTATTPIVITPSPTTTVGVISCPGCQTVAGAGAAVWNRKDTVIFNAGEPTVLVDTTCPIYGTASCYRMWYTTGWVLEDTNYAESLDGQSWQIYASNPVLAHANRNNVIKVSSTYHMYVSPADGSLNDTLIKHYTSADGLAWVLVGTAISHGTAGAWDDAFVDNSAIIIESGTWYMYYEGRKDSTLGAIGLATSSDGTTWVKSGSAPVMGDGIAQQVGSPSILKSGSTYYVWAGCAVGDFLPENLCRWSSTNRTTWTEDLPLAFARGTADEGVGLAEGQADDPTIVVVGSQVWLYYVGSPDGGDADALRRIKLAIAFMPLSDLVLTSEGASVPIPTPDNLPPYYFTNGIHAGPIAGAFNQTQFGGDLPDAATQPTFFGVLSGSDWRAAASFLAQGTSGEADGIAAVAIVTGEGTAVGATFSADGISGAGTAGVLIGYQSSAKIFSGSVSGEAIGARANVENYGAGTVPTASAFVVRSAVNSGAGHITNNRGLVVEDQTAGDNNWSILTGAGDIVLGTLATAGAATGKTVVCADTNGKLYRSSSGVACAN